MGKWCRFCLLASVALGPALACGSSDSGGGGSVDPKHFCDAWAAQCPKDVRDDFNLATCKTECETNGEITKDDCWFAACSVETGYCDNEQKDDVAINACGKKHGWDGSTSGPASTSYPGCTRDDDGDSICSTQGSGSLPFSFGCPVSGGVPAGCMARGGSGSTQFVCCAKSD